MSMSTSFGSVAVSRFPGDLFKVRSRLRAGAVAAPDAVDGPESEHGKAAAFWL
jgi:hypothetical protein